MVADGDVRLSVRHRVLDGEDCAHRAGRTSHERLVGGGERGGRGVEPEHRGGNRRDDPRDVPPREPVRPAYH